MNTSWDGEQYFNQAYGQNQGDQARGVQHGHGYPESFNYPRREEWPLVPTCGGNVPSVPVDDTIDWSQNDSGASRHSFSGESMQDPSLYSVYYDYYLPPSQLPNRQSEWFAAPSSFPGQGIAGLPMSASQPSLSGSESGTHARGSVSTQFSYYDQDSAPSLINSPMLPTHSGESSAYSHFAGYPMFDENPQALPRAFQGAVLAPDPSVLHQPELERTSSQTQAQAQSYPRQVNPPPADFRPDNPSMLPVRQPLRFAQDLYTPEWIRGRGINRQGYCTMCVPGRWLKLKSSSFWYHKTFVHGVSRETGRYFERPVAVRWVDESAAAASVQATTDLDVQQESEAELGSPPVRRVSEPTIIPTGMLDGATDSLASQLSTARSQSNASTNITGASCQGLCAHCNSWIPLGDGRRTKVFGAAWFRHASKCQTRQSAPVSRRSSAFMGVGAAGTSSPRRHRARGSDATSVISATASTPRSSV